MKHSEITLSEAIQMINSFLPIKIIYNDEVIYNDFDTEVGEFGESGETYPPNVIVPYRIEGRERNIINTVEIEIVHHHHSIVTLKGEA